MLKNSFLRNIFVMMGGSSFGSIFSLMIVPIISRIFDSSQYGQAALLLALANLGGNIAAFRYDKALILPKDQTTAIHLFNAAVVCIAAVVAFICLLLLFNMFFLFLPYNDSLGFWLYFVPLGILLVACNFLFDSWLIREKRYKKIALSQSADPVGVGLTRLSLGLSLGSSTWALNLGLLVGALLKMAVMLSACWRGVIDAVKGFDAAEIKKIMKSYKDFPIFSTPAGLANRLSNDLPVFVLGALFSPAIVGFYAIAMRILNAPVNVCSNSIRKVYNQRVAAQRNEGAPLLGAYLKVLALCIGLGVVPLGVLYVYGSDIVVIFLGEKWAEAGVYTEIIIPWLFTIWLTVPTSVVFEVLRRQRIWLVIQLFQLLLRSGVLYWSATQQLSATEMLQNFVLACVAGGILVLGLGAVFCSINDKRLAPR